MVVLNVRQSADKTEWLPEAYQHLSVGHLSLLLGLRMLI